MSKKTLYKSSNKEVRPYADSIILSQPGFPYTSERPPSKNQKSTINKKSLQSHTINYSISVAMYRMSLIFINFLMGLFLMCNFMRQNPFEYLSGVYIKTIAVICFFSALPCILNFPFRLYEKKHEKISILADGLVFLYFLLADFCIFNCTFFQNQPTRSYTAAYIVQTIIFILWKYRVFIPVGIILSGLVIFNAGKYYFRTNVPYHETTLSYGSMSYKPNIYLLILESYQGNEALKKLYNYDNQQFINELENIGFTIYHNAYSNSPFTRGALSSIFAIKDLTTVPTNLTDLLLTFPKNFRVSNTFLANGYQIDYIFPNCYFTQMDSRCRSKFARASLFSQNYFEKYLTDCSLEYKTYKNFINEIKKFATAEKEKPTLFITKIGGISENDNTYSGGLMHLPNKYRHSNKKDLLPELRKNYIEELQKGNTIIKDIVQTIIKTDPEGLIILMGDHSGQFFEIYKEESLTEISPFLEKNAINKKDYLLDMYNIFIAIKWPKDIKKETATINFAPELFKLILEKIIPNTKIPEPSHLFFNFEGVPIKDLFWEDI